MKKLKEYYSQTATVPMWIFWLINIYAAILILKWILQGTIFVLEVFL